MNEIVEVYECGCCGHYHEVGFWGDCRQDDARFTREDVEAKGWTEVELDEDGNVIRETPQPTK